KTAKTPTAAANAQASVTRLRQGSESAKPATARPATAGVANCAVASVIVASPAATTITAKPEGTRRGPGSSTPATCRSRRPQPSARTARTSGKTTQATSRVTGPSAPARLSTQPIDVTWPEATTWRERSGDGEKTSIS